MGTRSGRFPVTPACASLPRSASASADLPLRLAQRAFAAVLEKSHAKDGGAFHAAQLRQAARRTLSALSADDHARLSRWLALQLASDARNTNAATGALVRVDALLAAAVGAALVHAREDVRTDAHAA
jgi:sulfate adenylyltransferase subunit 1 (EFTu-like GTPase family)